MPARPQETTTSPKPWPILSLSLHDEAGKKLLRIPWTPRPQDDAPLAWDVRPAQGGSILTIRAQTLPPEARKLVLHMQVDTRPDQRIFCNGYQSWSESRTHAADAKMPDLRPLAWPIWRLFALPAIGDADFVRRSGAPGELVSHTLTYIRAPDGHTRLWGSLDEQGGLSCFFFDTNQGTLRCEKELPIASEQGPSPDESAQSAQASTAARPIAARPITARTTENSANGLYSEALSCTHSAGPPRERAFGSVELTRAQNAAESTGGLGAQAPAAGGKGKPLVAGGKGKPLVAGGTGLGEEVMCVWAGEGSLVGVMDGYFGAQGRPFVLREPLVGWTSWYHYYTGIDEIVLKAQIDAFVTHGIPIEEDFVFQIDDGWQQAVGDWEANEKFPSGMKALADAAHAAGMKAGLWLAPLICERRSRIFREHPDWLRRDAKGRPVRAGLSPDWKGNFYALNWRHPQARAYLEACFSRILDEWGFDLVKLDFLYAAAVAPVANRGEEMAAAMAWLRSLVGERLLLGCGVPLGPSLGHVDYCRIGSDIARKWEDRLLADVVRYPERVSTLNSLRSTIGRALFSGRAFGNDPDVFLLRSHNHSLTPTQQRTLYHINLALGSVLFTSDPIGEYNAEQLALYRKQFPHKAKRILDLHDQEDRGWVLLEADDVSYLLVYNLTPKTQVISLPPGRFFDLEGGFEARCQLAPFASRILRRESSAEVAILASDGHVFPGMDIVSLAVQGRCITLQAHPQATTPTQVRLKIPLDWSYAEVDGERLTAVDWQGCNTICVPHKP